MSFNYSPLVNTYVYKLLFEIYQRQIGGSEAKFHLTYKFGCIMPYWCIFRKQKPIKHF